MIDDGMAVAVVAVWFGSGAIGVALLKLVEWRAKVRFGIQPDAGKHDFDGVVAGPIALGLALYGLWVTRKEKGPVA